MNDHKDVERLGRKLYIWGTGIAFLFSIITITFMQILVYSFGVGLMARTALNTIALGAVLFVAAVLFARRGFKPIRNAVMHFMDASTEREKSEFAVEAGTSMERFPLRFSLMILALLAFLFIETGLLLLLQKELLGAIALNYILMGLGLSLASAFLAFFILHRFLDPLRELCYPYLSSQSGVRGVTIKARIIAMAVFLTVVFVILGWTTAEVYTIYEVRDQMLENCELHAALVGDTFDDMLAAEVSYDAQENVVAVNRLHDDEYAVLIDENGEPQAEFTIGDMQVSSIDEAFLTQAMERAVSEQFATGSFSNDSGSMIAAFAPTGFYGTRIVTIVPLSPFLGDATKVGYTFLYLSLIIALISAVIVWLTVVSFSKPLNLLVEAACVVGEGVLYQEVRIDSADETGRLSLTFREMLLNLRAMLDSSKDTALAIMGEAAKTQEIVNDSRVSLEGIRKSTDKFCANTKYETRRLRRIAVMTSGITKAIESRVRRRPSLKDEVVHADSARREAELDAEFADCVHAEGACAYDEKGEAHQADISGHAAAGLLDSIDAAERSLPFESDLDSLRESIQKYNVYERVLDFTVAALDIRKLGFEASRINEEIIAKFGGYSQESLGGSAVELLEGTGEISLVSRSDLVASAELSRDTADILQRIMDYLPLVMQILYEINSITEFNAELAAELSHSLRVHIESTELLENSCQRLAEMAILLQAQTQEFKTAGSSGSNG